MCGCAVIVALEHTGRPFAAKSIHDLSSRLDGALLAIKHRGPDSQGQWISPDGRVGNWPFSTTNEHADDFGVR